MNFKVFLRLVLVLVTAFVLIAGVVAGGVALSYRLLVSDEPNPDIYGSGDATSDTSDLNETKQTKEQVLNVMLLGVDKDGYRTDVMILAQYNFDTKKVNMLQIPRDTKRVDTNFLDPAKNKINFAYAVDKENEIFRAVDKLLGVEVDKYVLVNLDGFRHLVDEIGGVEVDVPINMNYDDPYQNLHIHLRKGPQVLDGQKAEMFVRFRKNNDGTGYPDGDLGRNRAQQQFIGAVIDKVLTVKNIFKIPKLVAIVVDNVKTNFGPQEIMKYVDDALGLKKEDINMISLPGDSRDIKGTSYFIHEPQETQKIIEQYFMPQIISQSMDEENSGNTIKQLEADEDKTLDSQLNSYKPSWKNKFINIEVLNGSGSDTITDKIAQELKKKEFKVEKIGELSGVHYSKTKAIDRTKKGYAKEVAKALGDIEIDKDLDESSDVDVTLIIGDDLY